MTQDIGDAIDRSLYLDLLKRMLTRSGFDETYEALYSENTALKRATFPLVRKALAIGGFHLVKRVSPDFRAQGRDWPSTAETMIGLIRLDSLQECIVDVLLRNVPGDLLEAGVWRGGATIFMRAILKAFGDESRTVWAADSFEGLPKPDPSRYPKDAGDRHWAAAKLAVSLDEVKANFERYGLMDDQVEFVKGWFRDTLPRVPIERLAVLRLDGDMYESTMVTLRSLYSKVSVGGYVIVDDYGAVAGCRAAVEDFRAEADVTEELHPVDWSAVYWKKA